VVLFSDGFKDLAATPLEASRLDPLRDHLDQINGLFAKRNALLKGYEEGADK